MSDRKYAVVIDLTDHVAVLERGLTKEEAEQAAEAARRTVTNVRVAVDGSPPGQEGKRPGCT